MLKLEATVNFMWYLVQPHFKDKVLDAQRHEEFYKNLLWLEVELWQTLESPDF